MTKSIFVFSLVGLVFVIGTVFGQRQDKANVSIDTPATYTIQGSALNGVANKKLTLYVLHYNDASIPCIVVDAHKSALNSEPTGVAISCDWQNSGSAFK